MRYTPECCPTKHDHIRQGLCKKCYQTERDKYMPQAICHPKKKAWTLSSMLCKNCHKKQQTDKIKPDCHPEKPYHANGLCKTCWRTESEIRVLDLQVRLGRRGLGKRKSRAA